MKLKIKVISYKGKSPVESLEASFDQDGGTLGRSAEKRKNHLILQDPEKFISRRHATIKSEKGLFYLTDTSVDGTYILNRNIHVCQNTVPLSDGDKLRIGDYELIVRISLSDELGSVEGTSAQLTKENDSIFDFNREKKTFELPLGELPCPAENSFSQSGKDIPKESLEQKHVTGQTEDSPIHDLFALPDLAEGTGNSREIPKNFNFEELINDLDRGRGPSELDQPIEFPKRDGYSNIEEHKVVYKEPPLNGRLDLSGANRNLQENIEPGSDQLAEKSIPYDLVAIEQIRKQAHLELFRVFLEGAGVQDTTFFHREDIPELMKTVGAVFKEMVEGLITILRGRAELKAQFRVSATILKPSDNNPLKFSQIVDDALRQLLTKDRAGFVDAVDAVREGFADIKNHQLAMTAGIQAAIIKLLERFNPQHFAKQYEEGVVFQRKAKSWDAYQQSYTEIANEALEDFFGESFVRAYEEQIRKLR